MNWEMLSATAALVGTVAGGLGLYVRLSLKSALGEFKAELIESLNGRYISRREADVVLGELARRLEVLERSADAR